MRARVALACLACLVALGAAPASAAPEPPTTLQDLLHQVETTVERRSAADAERLVEFRAKADRQARLLASAREEVTRLERASRALEQELDGGERALEALQARLDAREGSLGELFGVIRQHAGDLRAELRSSVASAEHPGRAERVASLASGEGVPTVDELSALWLAYQSELTRQSEVRRFEAPVVAPDGRPAPAEVVRVGPFGAVADGAIVRWDAEQALLTPLPRSPGSRLDAAAQALQQARGGLVAAPVDPTRGTLLGLLVKTPSLAERVEAGGTIGRIILGLGAVALLLGLLRLAQLSWLDVRVTRAARRGRPSPKDPLGRILEAGRAARLDDPEAFEARIDEAVLRETGRLHAGLWLVKAAQVAAPLLGLLGTVTGMINTFQAITIYGAGDARLMAGGISEALVTTMLGLGVAIPLVLVNGALGSRARRITEVLEEQAASLVAEQREGAPADGDH